MSLKGWRQPLTKFADVKIYPTAVCSNCVQGSGWGVRVGRGISEGVSGLSHGNKLLAVWSRECAEEYQLKVCVKNNEGWHGYGKVGGVGYQGFVGLAGMARSFYLT